MTSKKETYDNSARPAEVSSAAGEQAVEAVPVNAIGSDLEARVKYNKFALVAIVVAVAAWVALSFDGWVALGMGIVGLFAGIVGLRAATRAWRNTAITAMLASAVLLVVVSAFLIVIFVGLNSV